MPNRFPIRNASNFSSLTITLAGTIRLKPKAEAAEAAAATTTTTTATLSTTIRSCCPLEALSCRGGQSARRRRLRLCVSVCVCRNALSSGQSKALTVEQLLMKQSFKARVLCRQGQHEVAESNAAAEEQCC